MPQNVILQGPSPWGFRLSGGIDFNQPLIITRDINYFEHKHNIRPKPFIVSGRSSDPYPNSVSQSDVYKMLHANQEEPSQPRQSGSFKVLQNLVSEEDGRPVGTRSVKAPVTKAPTAMPGVQKVPLCDKCGNGILGTVVKARDKYRHPECFVCSDCNLNLKQKGYFFVEGQLYCEAHARARMKPPEGYETVTVYPKC
ncbi:PREDICTED: PDZ and LIM domain protein 3 isoform X4 [Acanthisitta chloris]|uniref:PDZ and LIM domain protein 3 isoform X4 n=1 Tax=Acanthisitta chloris TaxID=57068 RepID=UPI0004F0E743|nr:PREDICTED: PDZ and LIM domain protein 3 isoform X4 [Acanthisitta chloris]